MQDNPNKIVSFLPSKLTLSMPLDNPIAVYPILAVKFGLNEAIIIQQIHYWLKEYEKYDNSPLGLHLNKPHTQIGRIWVFNTLEQWQVNFPFWAFETVKFYITKLTRMGIIMKDNFNKSKADRTLWYTLDYNRLIELFNQEPELEQSNNGLNKHKGMSTLSSVSESLMISESVPDDNGLANKCILTETTSETTSDILSLSNTLLGDTPNPEKTDVNEDIQEYMRMIKGNKMFEHQVLALNQQLNIPEELLSTIDTDALKDCAMAMILNGIDISSNPFNYLRTSYQTMLSNHITNLKVKKQLQELEITTTKQSYITNNQKETQASKVKATVKPKTTKPKAEVANAIHTGDTEDLMTVKEVETPFCPKKYVRELFKTPEIQEVYLEYLKARKVRGFGITKFIMDKHKRELAKATDNEQRIEVITYFIMKGYQDFQYDWFANQNNNKGQNNFRTANQSTQSTFNPSYISNQSTQS